MESSATLHSLPPVPSTSVCYRVVRKTEYDDIQRDKVYKGSALDTKDGYLHMSYASEVAGTINKYYANIPDVHVLVIDMTKLGPPSSSVSSSSSSSPSGGTNLRIEWVPGRNNYFPHLYNIHLPIEAIIDTILIPLQADGTFDFTDTVFG